MIPVGGFDGPGCAGCFSICCARRCGLAKIRALPLLCLGCFVRRTRLGFAAVQDPNRYASVMPGQNNTFYSQTDTEVLIKLVDYYYKKYRMGPIDTITKTMVRVRSSYGLEVMFKDYPGEIYAARKDSPMIIGIAGGETYVAPDVPAILKYTRSVYYIGDRELASEFRYQNLPLDPRRLVVVISQSGETADSLAALREAKARGLKTLAIVNVVDSSIAWEADYVFYTLAGPEIAVATTKAYSAQLAACYALAMQFARVRGQLEETVYQEMIAELATLPGKVERVLEDKERIQWFAAKFANAHDVFFVGRGIDYAVSLEGSLKMKEISYIHSEAYASGELKHGTISLIEDGTLVIGVLTQSELFEKTVSNMVECKSRGAYLMGLTSYGNYSLEDTANFTVYIPKTDEHFAASLAVIPLQLLGYYLSVARGLDVDKPRNLAKSVTVE